MAWVFVRLKLRLLANAGASQRERAMAWIIRVLGLAAAAQAAASLASAPRHGGAGLIAVFVALTVAWIMFPLLAGSDQSLDPARLALLPLRRRDLVGGLFAASWVGAPPVATAIVVCGAAAECWAAGPRSAVVAADAVVMTVLAIATGRMVSAALAAAVRSRRGRDTASLVLAVVSAGSYVAWRLASSLAQRVDTLHPSRTTQLLSWTPPGALARSMVLAHNGDTAGAGLRLLYAALATCLILWAWAVSLERRLTSPEGGESGRRRSRRRAAQQAAVGRGPAGAVRWKDLRYLWRAPVQRATLITGIVTSSFIAVPLITGARRPRELLPYLGCVVALFVSGNLCANLFGVEREAFATYLLAGVDPADLVRGKAWAVTSVVGAVAGVVTVGAAILGGAYAELPSALLVACAVTAIGVGGGLVQSVMSPFPVAVNTPSFGRARRPRGRGTPGLGVLVFALEFAAAGVAVGLVALTRFGLGVGTLPGAVAAAGLGGAVLVLGARVARRRLAGRMPETLAALSARG
jgi:ABC-2 type transport system permease protein